MTSGQKAPLPSNVIDLYPGLDQMHAYAVAQLDEYWLIFGGLIEMDQVKEYPSAYPNTDIILIDTRRRRAEAYADGNLGGPISEQMSSSGMAYFQDSNKLYLAGGYGFSEEQQRFITLPYLTVIYLRETIEAIQAGKPPKGDIVQFCEPEFELFDAILDFNGTDFFLLGGKRAKQLGPHGHVPEYQEWSFPRETRTFQLQGERQEAQIRDLRVWYSLEELRDYFGELLPTRIQQKINQIENN